MGHAGMSRSSPRLERSLGQGLRTQRDKPPLTAQHHADIVRDLDETSTTATDRFRRALGHIRRNQSGGHAQTETTQEPTTVEHPQCHHLATSDSRDGLYDAPDEVYQSSHDKRFLSAEVTGGVRCGQGTEAENLSSPFPETWGMKLTSNRLGEWRRCRRPGWLVR